VYSSGPKVELVIQVSMLERKHSLALKDMFLTHRLLIYVDSVTRMKNLGQKSDVSTCNILQ